MELSSIFWDTNLFIYLIEDHAALSDRVVELLERIVSRGDRLHTSTMTLGEVLVKPVQMGDDDLRRRYEEVLSRGAHLLPFTSLAAVHYARIRTDRSIRQPDAIQLACAAQAGIDLFITNDDRLNRKNIPGIQFITSLDRAFL